MSHCSSRVHDLLCQSKTTTTTTTTTVFRHRRQKPTEALSCHFIVARWHGLQQLASMALYRSHQLFSLARLELVGGFLVRFAFSCLAWCGSRGLFVSFLRNIDDISAVLDNYSPDQPISKEF